MENTSNGKDHQAVRLTVSQQKRLKGAANTSALYCRVCQRGWDAQGIGKDPGCPDQLPLGAFTEMLDGGQLPIQAFALP